MSIGDGNWYTGEEFFGSYDPYDPYADWSNEEKGVGSGRSYESVGVDASKLPAPTKFGLGNLGDWAKSIFTGAGSLADYGTLLGGVLGLYEQMNKDRAPTTWQGTLAKGTYVPPTVSPEYTQAINTRGYGERAMGINPFTGGRYIAPTAEQVYGPPPPPPAPPPPPPPPAPPPPPYVEEDPWNNGLHAAGTQGGNWAKGGMAKSGSSNPPRYLRGETDGMADQLPSSIDGKQPAKLSHGEFVIPADVVSHLGNGNSDAGAKVLYKMMDRVRQARTGNKRQGKQIKPEKFMPGGIADIPRYSGGGAVAFQTGGQAPSPGTTAGGLSPWVGDYVAGPQGFLSKAWALGDQPYQAYQGPLTAGVSPLQEQAFTMAQNLGTPSQFGTATQMATQAGQAAGATSFTPGTFNTGLGPVGSVQSYMSPYMQSVVDIQAREARRQADIGRQAEQARLAQAGAYGGSRQAIMEAERQRNLGQQIGDIQEKGLQSAYDRAMEQRFKEAGLGMDAQRAGEQSRQFGAGLGLQGIGQQIAAAGQLGSLSLQGLDALSRAGATQQQAEQASVDAQLRQFQEAQQWPYKQLEFQRGLLAGLPVGTSTYAPNTSGFADLIGGIGDLLGLYKDIKAVG